MLCASLQRRKICLAVIRYPLKIGIVRRHLLKELVEVFHVRSRGELLCTRRTEEQQSGGEKLHGRRLYAPVCEGETPSRQPARRRRYKNLPTPSSERLPRRCAQLVVLGIDHHHTARAFT